MAYARKMVMELGMSEKLGPIALPNGEEGEVFLGRDLSRHNTLSDELARTIDEEILNLIHTSYARAKDIIIKHRAAFDKLVATLLEKEVVEANEIDEILGLKPAGQPENVTPAPADTVQQVPPASDKAESPAKQADLFEPEK